MILNQNLKNQKELFPVHQIFRSKHCNGDMQHIIDIICDTPNGFNRFDKIIEKIIGIQDDTDNIYVEIITKDKKKYPMLFDKINKCFVGRHYKYFAGINIENNHLLILENYSYEDDLFKKILYSEKYLSIDLKMSKDRKILYYLNEDDSKNINKIDNNVSLLLKNDEIIKIENKEGKYIDIKIKNFDKNLENICIDIQEINNKNISFKLTIDHKLSIIYVPNEFIQEKNNSIPLNQTYSLLFNNFYKCFVLKNNLNFSDQFNASNCLFFDDHLNIYINKKLSLIKLNLNPNKESYNEIYDLQPIINKPDIYFYFTVYYHNNKVFFSLDQNQKQLFIANKNEKEEYVTDIDQPYYFQLTKNLNKFLLTKDKPDIKEQVLIKEFDINKNLLLLVDNNQNNYILNIQSYYNPNAYSPLQSDYTICNNVLKS